MHPSMLAERTGLFAEGRFLGKLLDEWAIDAQEFIHTKLPHLLVIATIAFILNRILRIITSHMTRVAEQHSASPGRISQVKTLAGVIRTTGLAVIGVITTLQILEVVDINFGPLLASAGVAGIAIGLAAQNIVKDMLNGVLILLEDQFNVGDMVRVAGVAGTVESMTLRKTTVRDADGTLFVIPNSQIATVANLNAGYSVATVNVSVDFSANPDTVLDLLKTIAMEIRTSPEFSSLFLADPQILGVEAVKGSEVVFPVVFKTVATKQYGPVREFRRRVRLELEKNQLLPGDANRVFNSFVEPGSTRNGRTLSETTHEHDPTMIKPQEISPFTGE